MGATTLAFKCWFEAFMGKSDLGEMIFFGDVETKMSACPFAYIINEGEFTFSD